MILCIDASNILAGGGKTHLVELLNHATPQEFGFSKIVVYGHSAVMSAIEERQWLNKRTPKILKAGYLGRFLWQVLLRKPVRDGLWFVPGGGRAPGRYVAMCQNLLPVELIEIKRFGFSTTTIRLLLLRVLHFAAYCNATGLIVLTKYSYNALPHSVQKKQMNYKVIPHGVNHNFFYSRGQVHKNSDEFRFLYISIINNYKHQDKVARAIIRLREQGHRVKLTLVGPSFGPALARLNSIILGHSDAVEYIGKVPYSEIPDVYQNHDAFILASTCETFCMILTEAMAMGIPIACSSRSSLPETLGDAGVYFDPEVEISIDEAILRLKEDSELRQRLSQRALERVKNFDWHRCADETFKFLADAAKSACKNNHAWS